MTSKYVEVGRKKYGSLAVKDLRLMLRERGINKGIGGKNKDGLLFLLAEDDAYRDAAAMREGGGMPAWRADLGSAHVTDIQRIVEIASALGEIRLTLVLREPGEWELAQTVRAIQDDLDAEGIPIEIPRPTRVED